MGASRRRPVGDLLILSAKKGDEGYDYLREMRPGSTYWVEHDGFEYGGCALRAWEYSPERATITVTLVLGEVASKCRGFKL